MNFISSIRFSVFVCAVLALSVSASAQTTHYVSLDGECDGNTPCYSTIQAAIDAASNGDEVIVLPGTYIGNPVAAITNKTITLRSSGGTDVTFLTGPSIFQNTMTLSGVGAGTVVEGFTFRDSRARVEAANTVRIFSGSPTIRDCVFTNNNMVGPFRPMIYNTSSAGMTVSNCTFINNNSAAIVSNMPSGSTANVTIDGCSFIGNWSGSSEFGSAVHIQIGGNTSILNCDFVSNHWHQGSIFVRRIEGSATIDSCTFTDNTALGGAGVNTNWIQTQTGTVTIIDSIFDGNSASYRGGGAYLQGVNVSVIGCIFTNNTAAVEGGGLVLKDNASAINCTFSGNQTTGDGGGVFVLDSSPTISNCLITQNHADGSGGGLYSHFDAVPTITDTVFCHNTSENVVLAGLATFNGLNFITDNPDCVSFAEVGACCMSGGECVTISEAACLAAGGTYHGDETSCPEAECFQPCVGDLDLDGEVDVEDLFILLGNWGSCP